MEGDRQWFLKLAGTMGVGAALSVGGIILRSQEQKISEKRSSEDELRTAFESLWDYKGRDIHKARHLSYDLLSKIATNNVSNDLFFINIWGARLKGLDYSYMKNIVPNDANDRENLLRQLPSFRSMILTHHFGLTVGLEEKAAEIPVTRARYVSWQNANKYTRWFYYLPDEYGTVSRDSSGSFVVYQHTTVEHSNFVVYKDGQIVDSLTESSEWASPETIFEKVHGWYEEAS